MFSASSSGFTSYLINNFSKLFYCSKASVNILHYDIIIAGGGLIGTTLACALAKNNILSKKRILLLEGGPKNNGFAANKYSNRVSALNRNSVNLLDSINTWNTVLAERYQAIKQIKVWEASSHSSISFKQVDINDNLAYVVENNLILYAVNKELCKLSNVKVQNSSKIVNVILRNGEDTNNRVDLSNGESFTCDLLIGAEGANSLVRQQMKTNTFTVDYKQMGLVATLMIKELTDNTTAWQRFLPNGVIALLPLSKSLCSLVWSISKQCANDLCKLSPQDFVAAVNKAFERNYPQNNIANSMLTTIKSCFGEIKENCNEVPPTIYGVYDNSRACFPLGLSHTSTYAFNGAVLVGDAAHRIHPLAGQGVNLGFNDVKILTKILAEAVYSGYNLGNLQPLLKYERETLKNNIPLMLGVHGLQKIYISTYTPIVTLRSIGLHVTENFPLLKSSLILKAMGTT